MKYAQLKFAPMIMIMVYFVLDHGQPRSTRYLQWYGYVCEFTSMTVQFIGGGVGGLGTAPNIMEPELLADLVIRF